MEPAPPSNALVLALNPQLSSLDSQPSPHTGPNLRPQTTISNMSQEYPAIYEGGIFRPLTAPNLPEHTPVMVTVQNQLAPSPNATVDLQTQQQALNAMFAAVDGLPQSPTIDGLSNRDHDQILYGSP